MKYTEIVKTAPKAVLSHVDKNGVTYILSGGHNMEDVDLYSLTIPLAKLDDAKLLPKEKTIYFARLIREAIEEGTIVSLTKEDLHYNSNA